MFIDAFAEAIAFAEGFYVYGSRPARNNNPGNLTVDLIGKSVGTDGRFVIYATAADGWEALKKQIAMALDGRSKIYDASMSIADFASRYTTTEHEIWARNVAAKLGVAVDSTLESLVARFDTGMTPGMGGAVFVLLLAILAFKWGR